MVLMDLWWNPTTEEQAIDRAHRIGTGGRTSVCVWEDRLGGRTRVFGRGGELVGAHGERGV